MRQRLTSVLSVQEMDVTTYTFAAFEELFCLLESPIASRYHTLYRRFIFQGGSEEESGYWATDEVTGEQGYVDDKHLCFWSWDDNPSTWKSRPFKSRLLKRRQVEGKENEKEKNCLFIDGIFSFCFFFLKKTVIFFGNYAIGCPIALMILQLAEAPLRGDLQDLQRVWR